MVRVWLPILPAHPPTHPLYLPSQHSPVLLPLPPPAAAALGTRRMGRCSVEEEEEEEGGGGRGGRPEGVVEEEEEEEEEEGPLVWGVVGVDMLAVACVAPCLKGSSSCVCMHVPNVSTPLAPLVQLHQQRTASVTGGAARQQQLPLLLYCTLLWLLACAVKEGGWVGGCGLVWSGLECR